MTVQIDLPAIVIDTQNALEKEFSEWFAEKKSDTSLTKTLVLMGYASLTKGAGTYYESLREASAQRVINDLKKQLEEKERCLSRVAEDTRSIVSDKVSALIAANEAEMRRRLDCAERDACRDRNAYEDRIHRINVENQDYVTKLKTSMSQEMMEMRDKLSRAEEEIGRRVAQETQILQARHAKEMAEAKIENVHHIAQLTGDKERFRALYEDAQKVLSEYVSGMQSQKLSELQRCLQDKERKLAILEKSNSGKGIAGEATLSEYLRLHFLENEIMDTSRQKHSCDMWMKLVGGSFVAVESKNKSIVTSQDVDKFLFDVEYMCNMHPDKFLGAIFVSLRSRNIPHKGDMHVELRQGRPVMFVAFESDEDLRESILLKRCVSLCCAFGQQSCSVSRSETESIICQLRPLLRNIDTMRKSLDAVKAANKRSMDNVADMEKGIWDVFKVIQDIVDLRKSS